MVFSIYIVSIRSIPSRTREPLSLRNSLVRNGIGPFIHYFRAEQRQSQHDPAAVVEYRRRDNIGPGILTLHPSG
jgi:hypothetical protein